MDGFGEEAIVTFALVQPKMKGGVQRGVDKTSEGNVQRTHEDGHFEDV
jgi:hypothetical protein